MSAKKDSPRKPSPIKTLKRKSVRISVARRVGIEPDTGPVSPKPKP
jgi:hypothetical protein